MATIKDVAKLSGVSVSTVSLVLNTTKEQRRVSPETWEKVRKAMDTLGYRPNKEARNLRDSAKQIPTIGLFWPYHFDADILGRVLTFMHDAFESAYYDCNIVVHMFQAGKLNEYTEFTKPKALEGAVLAMLGDEDIEWLEKTNVVLPVVLLDREIAPYNTVRADNREMGRIGARMLIGNACKKTAILRMKDEGRAGRKRLEEFLKLYDDNGIEYKTFEYEDEADPEDIVRSVRSIIGEYRPDSIALFENDTIASTSMFAILSSSVKVPDEMKLVTVNMGLDEHMRLFSPSVTAVYAPAERMVADCANILVRHITDRTADIVHKAYPPEIYYGQSCPRC